MIISNAGPRTIIGEHPGRCNLLGCNVRDSSPYAVFGRRSPPPVADPGAGWGTARGFLCFTQHTGRCNLLGSYVEDSSPYTRSVADVLPFRLQTARGFLCFAHNTQAAAIFWGPTSKILRPARSLADVPRLSSCSSRVCLLNQHSRITEEVCAGSSFFKSGTADARFALSTVDHEKITPGSNMQQLPQSNRPPTDGRSLGPRCGEPAQQYTGKDQVTRLETTKRASLSTDLERCGSDTAPP